MKSNCRRNAILLATVLVSLYERPAKADTNINSNSNKLIQCSRTSSFPYLTLPSEEDIYLKVSIQNNKTVLDMTSYRKHIGQYFANILSLDKNWYNVRFEYPAGQCEVHWDTDLLFNCNNNSPDVVAIFDANDPNPVTFHPNRQFDTQLMKVALTRTVHVPPGLADNYLFVVPSGNNVSTQMFFDRCKLYQQ